MSDLAIDITGAAKTYRGMFRAPVHALRGVDMRVHRGEIFGLLGPNGAGKSTLVKILMTIVRASAGRGTLLDRRIGDKSVLRRVGYLPEHHSFPAYLNGLQVLDYFGALCGVERAQRRTRSGELVELVGLKGAETRRVGGYSKGMRQRLGLAQALMNDPELVVLDEPTDGVDPIGRRQIRDVLNELRSRGKAVFLNSHLLSELEAVCDRVAIMVQGQIGMQGTLDELTVDRRHIAIGLAGDRGRAEGVLRVAAASVPEGVGCDVEQGLLRIWSADAAHAQGAIDRLRALGEVIEQVRPVRPSLEDLFVEAVEKTGAEADGSAPATPEDGPAAPVEPEEVA